MSILHIQNVELILSNTSKKILKNINYEIQQNDFVILLGSNGSGKTTLLKLLHRDHDPTAGDIYYKGKSFSTYSRNELSQQIAVLTQNCEDSLFTSLTIYENYLLIKQKKYSTERKFLMNYLLDFNPNLTKKLNCLVSQLSGGEKQALALAFCLLTSPSILLLDEHTSALDPKTSEQIMTLTQRMVKQHHITCILTTHNLDIAMHYGNRILVLRGGEVYKTFDKKDYNLSKEMLEKIY